MKFLFVHMKPHLCIVSTKVYIGKQTKTLIGGSFYKMHLVIHVEMISMIPKYLKISDLKKNYKRNDT